MKFRLAEGEGVSFYWIGVRDNGTPTGISYAEMEETLWNLYKMSGVLSAQISLKEVKTGIKGQIAHIQVIGPAGSNFIW